MKIKGKKVSRKAIFIGAAAGATAIVATAVPLAIVFSKDSKIETSEFFYENISSRAQRNRNVLPLNIIGFEKFAWYDLKTNPKYVSLKLPSVKDYQILDSTQKDYGRVNSKVDLKTPGETTLFDVSKEKREIGKLVVSPNGDVLIENKDGKTTKLTGAKVVESDLTITVPFDVYHDLSDKAYKIWESNFYNKVDPHSTITKDDVRQRINDLHSHSATADGASLYKLDSTIKDELEKMYNRILKSKTMTELKPEIDDLKKAFYSNFGKQFTDAFFTMPEVVDFLVHGTKFKDLP